MEEKEGEMVQSELGPEFKAEEKEEKKKGKTQRRSTLRLTGYPEDYLPGIKEKIKPKRLERLRRAIAKGLGKDITYQAELEGLEKKEGETEKREEHEQS